MKKTEKKNLKKKKVQKNIGNCVWDATIIAHRKLTCVLVFRASQDEFVN
jgi:hypothetical protein